MPILRKIEEDIRKRSCCKKILEIHFSY